MEFVRELGSSMAREALSLLFSDLIRMVTEEIQPKQIVVSFPCMCRWKPKQPARIKFPWTMIKDQVNRVMPDKLRWCFVHEKFVY